MASSNHLVFLASMWREFSTFGHLHAKGAGSTVTKVVDGSLYGQRLAGIAGSCEHRFGSKLTGHQFLQANWYAFGRLAWNPDLSSRRIAEET